MMIWKANMLIYLEYTDNETSKERRNPTSDEEGWTEAEVDDEIRQRRAKKRLTQEIEREKWSDNKTVEIFSLFQQNKGGTIRLAAISLKRLPEINAEV
jgi:hypothetical protein